MIIILVFVLALALRLFLAPLGFHIDILSNAGWGQWIYMHGPLGFYENSIWIFSWPTQPPFVNLLYGFDNWLYIFLLQISRSTGNTIVQYHLAPGHMRWWFNFTKWFDTAKTSDEAVFSIGYLTSIKILPILADLGIAGLIYNIAKSVKGIKFPIIWSAIYLFSPFSWYLSSLWGQYDQLGFLPVLAAFILESQKKLPWLTPFLFVLSVAIKPTSLILAPFFIYLYFKNSHNKVNPLIAILLIGTFFIETTQVFTKQNLYYFTINELYGKIFLKSASRLSANAFNFWRPFVTAVNQTQDSKFLFLPAYIWSTLSFIVLNLVAFKLSRKITLENVIKGIFIIGAGSWIFMTNMLDRYFFGGVVSGLILCIYDKKLFKYWLPVSLIFWLNLFNQWWFPDFLSPLKSIMIWNDGLFTKILSGVNVVLFLAMFIRIINYDSKNSNNLGRHIGRNFLGLLSGHKD